MQNYNVIKILNFLIASTFGYTILRNFSNVYSYYFRLSPRETIILRELNIAAYYFRTEFHPNVKSIDIEFYPGNQGQISYEFSEQRKFKLKWKNIFSEVNHLKEEFEKELLAVRIVVTDSREVLKAQQICKNANLYGLFEGYLFFVKKKKN